MKHYKDKQREMNLKRDDEKKLRCLGEKALMRKQAWEDGDVDGIAGRSK